MPIPFSVLDLAPVVEGGTAADAFRNSRDLAQHAEKLGYNRYWLAEHHNMPGIASAATSVVIGHVAGGTKTIRVGAGGVMLPNHSPLVIAEQFGTLESLYPGRIDLGLGRAPGTDQRTMRALRRNMSNEDTFPDDVVELAHYFMEPQEGQTVHAYPGAGLKVPLWILGLERLRRAARGPARLALRVRLAFRAGLSADGVAALSRTVSARRNFSTSLTRCWALRSLRPIATTKRKRLATSGQRQFVNLRRGTPGLLQAPADSLDGYWSPAEKAGVAHTMQYAAIGSPETVRNKLNEFITLTSADELMITSQIYDHEARKRSYEIAAEARGDL